MTTPNGTTPTYTAADWVPRDDLAVLANRSTDTVTRDIKKHQLQTREDEAGRILVNVGDFLRIGAAAPFTGRTDGAVRLPTQLIGCPWVMARPWSPGLLSISAARASPGADSAQAELVPVVLPG